MPSVFYEIPFDRSKHVFHSLQFEEIIKDTIRFFNGTPVHKLPPPVRFTGTGVYALYYIGESPYYKTLYEANRLSFSQPIYVGKAVPCGWRQARTTKRDGRETSELYRRLREHTKSIKEVTNLLEDDFYCRFMILEGENASLISTVEAALIREFKPIWNSCLDGFGNHTPGRGRFNQAKSDWDVLHPGRAWASQCKGIHSDLLSVEKLVRAYFV